LISTQSEVFVRRAYLLYKTIGLVPSTDSTQANGLHHDDSIFFCVCQRNSVEWVLSGEKDGVGFLKGHGFPLRLSQKKPFVVLKEPCLPDRQGSD
jgi:hypothetical protein